MLLSDMREIEKAVDLLVNAVTNGHKIYLYDKEKGTEFEVTPNTKSVDWVITTQNKGE